jgi:hypothetical protein
MSGSGNILATLLVNGGDVTESGFNLIASVSFHLLIAIGIIIGIGIFGRMLHLATTTGSFPTGWNDRPSYDALVTSRKSISDYLTSVSADPTSTPMRQLTVATASYGGIFTENRGSFNPFIGTVDPDAARLQVEAGARAMILDIWPDPANRTVPVVCSMVDTSASGRGALNWWTRTGGLDKGVGRYSNWQLVTRNKVSADKIMSAAVRAAFNTPNSPQNGDPFFLILRLHGAMTLSYLNTLGSYVQAAIGPNGMPSEWNRSANAAALATEPITTFAGKCFVIVCPDINENYNSLPGVNTFEAFDASSNFFATTLGEVTNLLERTQNTVFFPPNNAAGAKTLTPKGFCVAQGTVGGVTADNDPEFAINSFQQCAKYGVQFIGINLLAPSETDVTAQTFFNKDFFATYSYKFTTPPATK